MFKMYHNFEIHELVDFTKKLKILYVEDNEEAREAILDLIKNFFNDITVAVDGQDGLSKFKDGVFDLVISDIRMPKMDGIEMIVEIRELQPDIPIIVATAHKETELLIDCIKIGVDGYLLKPINFTQLKKTIIQTCEKLYYKMKSFEHEKSLEELIRERTKELEATKAKLTEMVNIDTLTNLYNRRYFNEISKNIFNIAKREKRKFSALMVDIDRFKIVNDTYGHLVGDEVLIVISNILLKSIRASDIAVRFGGEEFVILLPNTNIDGASRIAQKIKHTIETKEININDKNNHILKLTVSIGVSECDCLYDKDIDNIIHRSDEALYEAKRTGRNRIVIYEKKDV
jgi:diguanylate cyclase (GGDEF)-like protein